MAKNNKKPLSDGVGIHGFFRIKIKDSDGKVAGDSGWRQNQVVNDGFRQYLTLNMAGLSGSKLISYAMLGSGTVPGASSTSLDGELVDVANMRCAVTPTTIGSKTVQFAFTLQSNLITAAKTISNVGLINHSSTSVPGTIFSGNTYASSALATNQSVEASYQIRFS